MRLPYRRSNCLSLLAFATIILNLDPGFPTCGPLDEWMRLTLDSALNAWMRPTIDSLKKFFRVCFLRLVGIFSENRTYELVKTFFFWSSPTVLVKTGCLSWRRPYFLNFSRSKTFFVVLVALRPSQHFCLQWFNKKVGHP